MFWACPLVFDDAVGMHNVPGLVFNNVHNASTFTENFALEISWEVLEFYFENAVDEVRSVRIPVCEDFGRGRRSRKGDPQGWGAHARDNGHRV